MRCTRLFFQFVCFGPWILLCCDSRLKLFSLGDPHSYKKSVARSLPSQNLQEPDENTRIAPSTGDVGGKCEDRRLPGATGTSTNCPVNNKELHTDLLTQHAFILPFPPPTNTWTIFRTRRVVYDTSGARFDRNKGNFREDGASAAILGTCRGHRRSGGGPRVYDPSAAVGSCHWV